MRTGNTEGFVKRLKSFFSDIPYDLIKNTENHYQNVVFILFKLMGFYTQAKYRTSEGRIYMVVKTPKFCYVLEFKLNGSASTSTPPPATSTKSSSADSAQMRDARE